MKLPAIATGITSSHSQRASCMRLTHHHIAAPPTPKVTRTWTRPLYQGLISATYFSRNLRCRSVIMGASCGYLRDPDILVVDQRGCQIRTPRGAPCPPPQ